MRDVLFGYWRWRVQRAIKRELGPVEAAYVKALTDVDFPYYVHFRQSGVEHHESLRLARIADAHPENTAASVIGGDHQAVTSP